MRALVVSRNRVVGLGLVALAERCGLSAATVSIQQLASPQSQDDLVLVYCDQWGAYGSRAAAVLRARHVPFIVVARAVEAELRREVLAAGALHVFRPDETTELRAVLTNFNWTMWPPEDELTLGNGAVVDLRTRRIRQGGLYRELTLTEARLLEVLRDEGLQRRGQPVEVQTIVREVWGTADARSRATLRGHISRLRAKVEEDPSRPTILIGRRGKGYLLIMRRSAPAVQAASSS